MVVNPDWARYVRTMSEIDGFGAKKIVIATMLCGFFSSPVINICNIMIYLKIATYTYKAKHSYKVCS